MNYEGKDTNKEKGKQETPLTREELEQRRLESKDRLNDAYDRLLKSAPYYGLFLDGYEIHYHRGMPTMGVSQTKDGKNHLHYGDGQSKWPDDFRPCVLKHEILHTMLEHHYRRGQKDPNLWNVACDIAINQLIEWPSAYLDEKCKFAPLMPKDSWPKYASADTYYRIIEKECEKNPDFLVMGEGLGGGEGEGDGEGDSDGQQGQEATGAKGLKGVRIDSHDGWVDAPENRDKAQSDLQKQVKEVCEKLKQGGNVGRQAGHGTNGVVEEIVTSIIKGKPRWQDEIARGLGNILSTERQSTWKRVNRRSDLIKGFRHERKASLVLAVDTSGSMDSQLLSKIFSELQDFVSKNPQVQATVIECDCSIHKEYLLTPTTKCDAQGRGGTAFMPVYERVKILHPDQVLYFTDGETGDASQLNSEGAIPFCDWVWVLYGSSRSLVEWGRVIQQGGYETK